MKVKGITNQELDGCIDVINKKYVGNIIYNRKPEKQGNFLLFTIKCRDSHAPGHRRHRNKISPSACWHVHGDLFDAIYDINPEAVIIAAGLRMESRGDNWQDRNIGSQMFPLYYSESCDCI